MDSLGKETGSDEGPPPSPAAAARMLHNADSVSARVAGGLDLRAEAKLQRWTPAILFVYVATFTLLFTHQAGPSDGGWPITGPLYANILIIPLLTQLTLIQGARNRLAIATTITLQGRKLLFLLLGAAVFAAMLVASVFGIEIPWWLCLVLAALVAAPSTVTAVAASQKARNSEYVSRGDVIRPPLGLRVRAMTLGLGVYFGFAGFSTVQSWFPTAAFALVMGMVVLLLFPNTSWGLASIGSQWRKYHWVAFGISFVMLCSLTLLVLRARWDDPVVGVVGGLGVAAPLVIAALVRKRRS